MTYFDFKTTKKFAGMVKPSSVTVPISEVCQSCALCSSWLLNLRFPHQYDALSWIFVCVCVCVQTFKFNAGFFGSDPGHVVLLSDRLGQHALQPLQRGVALLCERRQTLVTGVEGRDVGVSVL